MWNLSNQMSQFWKSVILLMDSAIQLRVLSKERLTLGARRIPPGVPGKAYPGCQTRPGDHAILHDTELKFLITFY